MVCCTAVHSSLEGRDGSELLVVQAVQGHGEAARVVGEVDLRPLVQVLVEFLGCSCLLERQVELVKAPIGLGMPIERPLGPLGGRILHDGFERFLPAVGRPLGEHPAMGLGCRVPAIHRLPREAHVVSCEIFRLCGKTLGHKSSPRTPQYLELPPRLASTHPWGGAGREVRR